MAASVHVASKFQNAIDTMRRRPDSRCDRSMVSIFVLIRLTAFDFRSDRLSLFIEPLIKNLRTNRSAVCRVCKPVGEFKKADSVVVNQVRQPLMRSPRQSKITHHILEPIETNRSLSINVRPLNFADRKSLNFNQRFDNRPRSWPIADSGEGAWAASDHSYMLQDHCL